VLDGQLVADRASMSGLSGAARFAMFSKQELADLFCAVAVEAEQLGQPPIIGAL
jgi:hypothetical protein